jgi:phytol kinase
MFGMLFATPLIFGLLKFAEFLRKTGRMHGEISRKFVHITVGSFVAFWPFFMETKWILFMCGAFFAVVLASRYFKWFPAIYSISRRTWGDLLFPVGIAASLLLADSVWIFAAAMLHLSLADGFAAVVGERHGKTSRYRVFGSQKSVVGTFVFWAISLMIITALLLTDQANFGSVSILTIIWLPALAALLENLAIRGVDNIVVPISTVLLLNTLLIIS